MLNSLKSFWNRLFAPPGGYGACKKCACGQFTSEGADDLCMCGHTFDDHW
jgi:hypothetical protein